MNRIILVLTLLLTACSGSLEHLSKNIKDDEAIIFGRITVTDPTGLNITGLCNLALTTEQTKGQRFEVAGTNLTNDGLLVEKVPVGKVGLNRILCVSALGNVSNISIKGSYFDVTDPKTSYYFHDISIKLSINEKKEGVATIKMSSDFSATGKLYWKKMKGQVLSPIHIAEWKSGVIK